MRHIFQRSSFGALSVAAFGAIVSIAAQAEIQLHPGVIEGKEVHLANARDYAYCELAPVLGTPPNVVAQYYNTSGTEGVGGNCPHDKFIAIDAKTLAKDLGAEAVYMNPTPQTARRHWVMDQLWAFKAGETVDFLGVKSTWVAFMSPEQMRNTVKKPYQAVEIHRESKYLYAAGSTVFLMRTPEKITYVMQSYATEVDKNLSFDQLSGLGSKLTLPAGWTFEAKTLTEDLTIDPRKAEGVAHIIRDDLHNVYEGCGFDAACNYAP